MKTIDEILNSERIPSQIIEDLKFKTVSVPPWSKLEKEYEPKYHPVMTDKTYRDFVNLPSLADAPMHGAHPNGSDGCFER